jgi:hypothetical protein
MKFIITPMVIGAILLLGAGCFQKTEYVEAPISTPVHIEANLEGAKASTGGQEATITPQLKTVKLVDALPDPDKLSNTTADQPIEQFNPVPLPDGTRTEYTSVAREYTVKKETEDIRLQVTISDTRGIPVVSAFTKSFTEFDTPDGYRRPIDFNGAEAWVQYTYDPEGLKNGFGSFTMLYRERFLIQIDGSLGMSEDELIEFANAFDYTQLD